MNGFEKAIQKAGGFARLPDGTGRDFAASIQPERADGGIRNETGTGHLYKFTLHTSCEGDAALLREGGVIEYQGCRYVVEHIADFSLGGKPVYRRGTVIRKQESDY